MFYVRQKGQSTLEYVMLLGFVVSALIAMGVYMKRGTEGKLRESTDQVGEQYEAGNTTSKYDITTNLSQTDVVSPYGLTTTTITTNKQTKIGNETVEKLPDLPE